MHFFLSFLSAAKLDIQGFSFHVQSALPHLMPKKKNPKKKNKKKTLLDGVELIRHEFNEKILKGENV